VNECEQNVPRLRGRALGRTCAGSPAEVSRLLSAGTAFMPVTPTYTEDQLRELLKLWQQPGGVLAPAELRALLSWSETSAQEREELEAQLAATQQVADAKPLAPNQRRGHVSLTDRVRAFFSRR
jgi:hypothetical protein